jgi:hypothetical protein
MQCYRAENLHSKHITGCMHDTCAVTFDFLNENLCLNCPKLREHPKFVSVLLQLTKTQSHTTSCTLLHVERQIQLPMWKSDSFGQNSNSDKHRRPNSTFCKAKCNCFIIKPTRRTNFLNSFCQDTLHISGRSSAHHQEFVNCTLANVICHTAL